MAAAAPDSPHVCFEKWGNGLHLDCGSNIIGRISALQFAIRQNPAKTIEKWDTEKKSAFPGLAKAGQFPKYLLLRKVSWIFLGLWPKTDAAQRPLSPQKATEITKEEPRQPIQIEGKSWSFLTDTEAIWSIIPTQIYSSQFYDAVRQFS